MSKFNTTTVKPNVTSPVQTEKISTGRTHQGGAGYARDAKSELFLLAVTNMVGENTFYERAGQRDERFEQLVHQVAREDPDWLVRMIPWLRTEANMRSASLVMAAEMVAARLDMKDATGNGDGVGTIDGVRGFNRRAIDEACQRADEPAEMLAYWISKYGKALPQPVKRGLTDAQRRLYNERSLLKYDSKGDAVRMGDVVELTHPSPDAGKRWQGPLFEYAIDRRHDRDKPVPDGLKTVTARKAITSLDATAKAALLESDNAAEQLREAGMTWEATAGWKQGKMDARTWGAQIPSMGYMATIRNLRNFDEAKISEEACNQVAAKIANADEVKASRQFPFRFLAAYKNAGLRWAWPLEQALNMSLENVPVLKGRTLILVDRSGSMFGALSEKTQLDRADSAALFGSALALRAEKATLVQYGTSWKDVPFTKGDSILRMVDRFTSMGGTSTQQAVSANYKAHDRVIVLTDEQTGFGGWGGDVFASVPKSVPCFTWNLAGYRMGHAPSGSDNRHTFGGLSDQAFRLVELLEAGKNGDWPF